MVDGLRVFLVPCQIDVLAHDRDQIIKVVGESAGQFADSLYPMRLNQLMLQLLSLSNVSKGGEVNPVYSNAPCRHGYLSSRSDHR